MVNKKKQINLIIALIIILIAVIFVILNTELVAINFGFFNVKLPLIIILVVMVIIGVLIGWFIGGDRQLNKTKN